MSIRISRRTLLAATLGVPGLAGRAPAVEALWPRRMVRVVQGFGPGGGTDAFARIYGDYVTQRTGHAWVHEYKPGGTGTLAALEVMRAEPDGHTLLFTPSTTLIQNRVTYRSLPYDPDRDLTAVSFLPAGSLALMVSPARTTATNLREFVEQMRGNPQASVGTFGPGTTPHIAFSEMNRQYGLEMQVVHYRGAVKMWTDLAAGVLDAGIGSYTTALPFIQKGVARVVATTPERLPALPDIPSCAEQGARAAIFRLMGYHCCIAPAGTPAAVIERISALFQEASRLERIRTLLTHAGLDYPALPVEQSRRRLAEEGPLWIGSVKKLGLTPE